MAQYWHLLPSNGYMVGFIPRVGRAWSPQISGWYKCFAARAIMTLYTEDLQAETAASVGYQEIMINDHNGLVGTPASAPPEVTHIYLDEPLSSNAGYGNHWNFQTLRGLAVACREAGRKLAIGEAMGPDSGISPDPTLYEYIQQIIEATHPTLGDNLLIMPMHYYGNGWSPVGQGGNVGSLNAWWTSMRDAFPTVKFAPWIAPTCRPPHNTTGCNSGWIEESLSHAKSISWKKVFLYLNDGFQFPTGVRDALLNTGWAYRAVDDVPQNGCEFDVGAD